MFNMLTNQQINYSSNKPWKESSEKIEGSDFKNDIVNVKYAEITC